MCKMYNILTLNKIASCGLDQLDADKYVITDDEGTMIGVRDDMPESAWPDYEAFLEEQRYAEGHHMKI